MPKDSIVEIPAGSGNKYRYEYSDGATIYRGPVGSAPDLAEEEFLREMEEKTLVSINFVGGIISSAAANKPGVEVALIESETDFIDEDYVVDTDGDGYPDSYAFIQEMPVATEAVEKDFKLIRKHYEKIEEKKERRVPPGL